MLPGSIRSPGNQPLLSPVERFTVITSQNPNPLLVQSIDLRPEGHAPSLASRKNDARLSLALKAIGMGTWEWDVPGNHMDWDARMHHLFGLEPGKFGGRYEDFLALVHPGDRDRLAEALHFSSRPDPGHDSEFRAVMPNSEVRTIRVRCRVFCRRGMKPSRILGVAWDVSNRRASEEAYARDRHLLTALMDHIPDNIYFKDRESRFIAVNRAMGRLFGKADPSELLGKTDLDVFSAEHAFRAMEDERRIMESGEPVVNVEERETWPDGRVTWVSSTKMPLTDARGRIIGTFGVSRDITLRKRAERELARVAAELRTKNQALEEDLGMARELQNALLPQQFPCFPRGSSEADSAIHFHHIYKPSTAVSGDFFDVFEIEESVAGLFICDVMGHGVRAALVASILRALVNELEPLWKEPSKFMFELNRALRRILKHTRVPLFASAFYVVADLANGSLTHANAGHPCPLRVQGSGGPEHLQRLDGCKLGPALGLLDDAQYPSARTEIVMPETILLFTDGLFEVEAQDGTLYDYKALYKAVGELRGLRSLELCQSIVDKVCDFSGQQQFADDVCLVAMEIDRLAPAAPENAGK
jgi:sigma-B regulation protein RsbU (phosphoserine phosphatase)